MRTGVHFVASLVPLERTTEASECSSGAGHQFGYVRRKTSQDYAKYLGVRAERGEPRCDVAELRILIKLQIITLWTKRQGSGAQDSR